jgi:hypothetical protein
MSESGPRKASRIVESLLEDEGELNAQSYVDELPRIIDDWHDLAGDDWMEWMEIVREIDGDLPEEEQMTSKEADRLAGQIYRAHNGELQAARAAFGLETGAS